MWEFEFIEMRDPENSKLVWVHIEGELGMMEYSPGKYLHLC